MLFGSRAWRKPRHEDIDDEFKCVKNIFPSTSSNSLWFFGSRVWRKPRHEHVNEDFNVSKHIFSSKCSKTRIDEIRTTYLWLDSVTDTQTHRQTYLKCLVPAGGTDYVYTLNTTWTNYCRFKRTIPFPSSSFTIVQYRCTLIFLKACAGVLISQKK